MKNFVKPTIDLWKVTSEPVAGMLDDEWGNMSDNLVPED